MTPFRKAIDTICNKMYKSYKDDAGKMLVHLGAAGWVLSSLAQLSVLITDRKIDKKKKKFLIPQEFCDAVVNVGLYYSICDLIKKGADSLVERGKLITDEVLQDIVNIDLDKKVNIKDWKQVFTEDELADGLTKALSNKKTQVLSKMLPSRTTPDTVTPIFNKAIESFAEHKNNVGTVAAVAASVLACNIVTPYVRNILASKYQNYALHESNTQIRKEQITRNITMKNPLPKSFDKFNNYNTFRGIKI